MKAIVDGEWAEVKTVENLGYQGGYLTKAVIYNGEERILIKKDGKWQARPQFMKF